MQNAIEIMVKERDRIKLSALEVGRGQVDQFGQPGAVGSEDPYSSAGAIVKSGRDVLGDDYKILYELGISVSLSGHNPERRKRVCVAPDA